MSNEFNIFPEEDTTIICRKPDGTTIEVDAMDLDQMAIEVYHNRESMPVNEYLSEMCAKFKQKYGFPISMRSMDYLIDKKRTILEELKKNSFPVLEPVNSMESSQNANETSES